MTTFAEHYVLLVHEIMSEEASYELNQRTNSQIALLPEGYSFSIDLGDNILPTCGIRRTRPHISAAEAAWCFSGSTKINWLQKHTKIWDQFADDYGNVMEAYGYRWKTAFNIDQLQTAIDRLQKDSTDRRIWISSYSPWDLEDRKQKTVPCPVGFTLSIHDSRLNSSLMIRSSDVFIGLPLDVMRHALVMRAISASLNINLGHMRVTLAHPHIYEAQWDQANTMLEQDIRIPDIKMPDWTVDQITSGPDQYVEWIRLECIQAMPWPEYDPRVVVVK